MANSGNRKLLIYILGAYGLSGLFALPLILNPHLNSGIINSILMLLAQFGPVISAIAVTLRFDGKKGIRALAGRVLHWRFAGYIYILVFTIPAIFMFSGVLLGAAVFKAIPTVWIMLPNTVLTAFLGPLGEELGWRGIATSELQKTLSPLKTSLVLGCIWAGWHFWLFLIPGMFRNDTPLLLFLLSCIADTLWFTWFYNKSGSSILAGMLFHFAYNLTYHIVPINPVYFYGNITPYSVMVVLELALGVVVNLTASGRKNILAGIGVIPGKNQNSKGA